MFKEILITKDNHITTITINREDKLNALNNQTFIDLDAAFTELESDNETKVVIIRGAGEKSFVAGADIKELSEASPEDAFFISSRGQAVFNKIENFKKPVIAVIPGFALGGGCELAMACHLRIAGSKARFGQPEINLGLIPGYGGTQRLTRLIGKTKALELLMTGDMISADEAKSLGLVNYVFEIDTLFNEAYKLAEHLTQKSQLTLSYILSAVQNGALMNQNEANHYEASLFALTFSSDDAKEGTQAFLEKRKANFQGK